MEVWKTIPAFPAYEASSLGRVRRGVPGVNTFVGKILRIGTSPNHRYLTVGLMRGGRPHTTLVHRAVAEAFSGACPPSHQVSHVDGNPHNNSPDNLIYEPATINNRRKSEHGTLARGTGHKLAKLTEAEVLAIRAQAATGAKHRDLAARFGCAKTTITRVASRQSWAHLSEAN